MNTSVIIWLPALPDHIDAGLYFAQLEDNFVVVASSAELCWRDKILYWSNSVGFGSKVRRLAKANSEVTE